MTVEEQARQQAAWLEHVEITGRFVQPAVSPTMLQVTLAPDQTYLQQGHSCCFQYYNLHGRRVVLALQLTEVVF